MGTLEPTEPRTRCTRCVSIAPAPAKCRPASQSPECCSLLSETNFNRKSRAERYKNPLQMPTSSQFSLRTDGGDTSEKHCVSILSPYGRSALRDTTAVAVDCVLLVAHRNWTKSNFKKSKLYHHAQCEPSKCRHVLERTPLSTQSHAPDALNVFLVHQPR